MGRKLSLSWMGLLSILLGAFPSLWAQGPERGTIYGRVLAPTLTRLDEVVISLEGIKGDSLPPKAHAIMDQRNLIFLPFVLPIQVGTTVDFPNSDEVRHNVFSPSKAKRFNLGIYPMGQVKSITFDRPGVVLLLCNVHPEMAAFILVKEHPYFTVTDRDGRYVLTGLPPGRRRVQAWHPRLKAQVREVELKPGERVEVNFSLNP